MGEQFADLLDKFIHINPSILEHVRTQLDGQDLVGLSPETILTIGIGFELEATRDGVWSRMLPILRNDFPDLPAFETRKAAVRNLMVAMLPMDERELNANKEITKKKAELDPELADAWQKKRNITSKISMALKRMQKALFGDDKPISGKKRSKAEANDEDESAFGEEDSVVSKKARHDDEDRSIPDSEVKDGDNFKDCIVIPAANKAQFSSDMDVVGAAIVDELAGCNPSDESYARWKAVAEANRRLREALGLPTED